MIRRLYSNEVDEYRKEWLVLCRLNGCMVDTLEMGIWESGDLNWNFMQYVWTISFNNAASRPLKLYPMKLISYDNLYYHTCTQLHWRRFRILAALTQILLNDARSAHDLQDYLCCALYIRMYVVRVSLSLKWSNWDCSIEIFSVFIILRRTFLNVLAIFMKKLTKCY